MKLLRDEELVELIRTGLVDIDEAAVGDWYDKVSPVQPASLDLSIGKIFVPEVNPDRIGGFDKPKTKYHTLRAGETALVEVKEYLKVPNNLAGFGFPPASVAVKGILMTNPGHIDPGFAGRLTFTLINMGKDSFTIRVGDIVFTTMWVELSADVEKNFSDRTNGLVGSAKEEDIDVLSKDFMQIDARAKKTAMSVAKFWVLLATIIAALITLSGTLFTNYGTMDKRVQGLSENIAVLENKLQERKTKKVAELEESFEQLEAKVAAIDKKVSKKLENKP